jgi:ATP-binding protein involved in chromosome partitioning
MSHYICPCCGTKAFLFGESGAKRTATAMDLEFLGEV